MSHIRELNSSENLWLVTMVVGYTVRRNGLRSYKGTGPPSKFKHMAEQEPTQTLAVVVTSPNGVKADAELQITEWTDNKRAAIAWKRLGLWWLAGVFLLIIPPHILWLTLAFIGGIVAFILAMRQQALVHPQEVICPDCHTAAKINEQPAVWPLGARCGECRLVLWVEPKDKPANPR